ncbi:hypothetical protein HOLleu_27776 [Holothuria leucospilota]|uniref:Uncharacterized protein n=1 Tax=Holothuria leucospilota TaxID=206669 RepID=A0A9Q1H3Q1_HOLLE|nr:hypothetical protein HOLleu_27776 [Holothuria leucospilota]
MRYGPESRSRTLASLKPEISQALDSLVSEINSNVTAVRASASFDQARPKSKPLRRKICPLCKEAKRPHMHFLSQCKYLPEEDRQYLLKAQQITDVLDSDPEVDDTGHFDFLGDSSPAEPFSTNRVQTSRSPYIDMVVHECPVRLTIDSGATGNMIKHSTAQRIRTKITTSCQSANQADGTSPLHVTGETTFTLQRGEQTFTFELELQPTCSNTELAIEPHTTGKPSPPSLPWPSPAVVRSIGGVIRISNDTGDPVSINKYEHVCQVTQVYSPTESSTHRPSPSTSHHKLPEATSPPVSIDPDHILTPSERNKFLTVVEEFAGVFNPNFPGYNGFAGKFEAVVNMGPTLPPQRKGRLPLYNANKLKELQRKFDELETLGVFARPEDVGVNVEYVNPSFLVKKSKTIPLGLSLLSLM